MKIPQPFVRIRGAFAYAAALLPRLRARIPALAPAEKIALAVIAAILVSGAALRAWERSGVRLGPVEDWETLRALVMRSREDPANEEAMRGGYPCAVEERPERFAAGTARAPVEILAAGAAGPAKRAESGTKPGTPTPVDPNTAGEKALLALPGVGPSTAKAILAHRETHGKFRSVDDLLRVKGIGPKKLEALRPHLRLAEPVDPTAAN